MLLEEPSNCRRRWHTLQMFKVLEEISDRYLQYSAESNVKIVNTYV